MRTARAGGPISIARSPSRTKQGKSSARFTSIRSGGRRHRAIPRVAPDIVGAAHPDLGAARPRSLSPLRRRRDGVNERSRAENLCTDLDHSCSISSDRIHSGGTHVDPRRQVKGRAVKGDTSEGDQARLLQRSRQLIRGSLGPVRRLYRSTDPPLSLWRSHSAQFESLVKNAPSSRGAKHLRFF